MQNEIKSYLIADTHFGHKNILTLASRRFTDIKEHDDYLIKCINETVTTSDHLYILGDLGFHKQFEDLKAILLRINTRNIHVILGNHDNKQHLLRLAGEHVICEVTERKILKVVHNGKKVKIDLFHFPMREWDGYWRGSLHAFGHVHGTLPPFERSMDVGVDSIGYHPIEVHEFINRINENMEKSPASRITKEDEMINEFFPDLSVHYFVGLCTGNKEIRDKIIEVLTKE